MLKRINNNQLRKLLRIILEKKYGCSIEVFWKYFDPNKQGNGWGFWMDRLDEKDITVRELAFISAEFDGSGFTDDEVTDFFPDLKELADISNEADRRMAKYIWYHLEIYHKVGLIGVDVTIQ